MEHKNRLAVFDNELEKIINRLLREVDEKISNIDKKENIDKIRDILIEANSLVNLACGDDDDKYEKYRFRLIISNKNEAYIIQGTEIDVDFCLYDGEDDQE